jgi:galactan 5-O-arabinofuranosyltransferase
MTRGNAQVALVCVLGAVGAVDAVVLCPPATTLDPTTTAVVAQIALVAMMLGAGVVVASPVTARTKGFALALLVALYLLTAATLTLSANDYAPFGAGVDQSFRTAYLTKLAAHWSPVDFAYRGLPWFYPPTYFWVLAHAGRVFGIPAWQMLKVGVLAGAAIVPFVSLGLWSRLVSWHAATAIVIATLVVQDWYSPHEWMVAVAFVPWWLICWQLDHPRRRRMILLGALGALIISTYYYFVLIGILLLVAALVARRAAKTHDLGPRDLGALLETLTWSVILSIWYWGPLCWSALKRGSWDPLQNRFYGVGSVAAPLPFLTFDLVGVILLGGLVFLATNARRSPIARRLALLLAAAYLWYGLNYMAIVAGVPLLSDKAMFLIKWILAVAAALGAIEVARWLRTRASGRWPAGLLAVVVIVVALGQSIPKNIPYVDVQRAEKYPTTLLADYQHAVGNGPQVVLSDVIPLDLYLANVYVFNVWNANYANPVADFSDRAALIRQLGTEHDPAVFALVLADNRYDRITQVVFRLGDRTYSFDDDNFPNGTKHRIVAFQPEAFNGFTQILTPDLEILVPPPLQLRDVPCPTLRTADRRYGPHLNADIHTRAQHCHTPPRPG